MEQKPPSEPKVAWEKEEEEGPGAAPAQQPEEMEQSPALLEGTDQTQEQDSALDRFRRTAQMVCQFIKNIRKEEARMRAAGVIAYSDVFEHETSAALLDLLVEHGVSIPKQVPGMVRYIHQWLKSNESAEHRLDSTVVDLAEEYPADVVITLLRVAPSCDRAAMTMWKAIMTSPKAAELAMLTLLDVLANWPKHSTFTCDGELTDVFALAATVVMWKILQVPCGQHVLMAFFPIVFVHLLFQVFSSTLDTPEEVEAFWKGCQEQHGLATKPNSFAVRTLKALLCLQQCEHVVLEVQRRHGWDTLLCADTHHYAVGVLAREMRNASVLLSGSILCSLLDMLCKERPYWDFPALAFLVEVVPWLDLKESGDSIMQLLSRHLQSERREIRLQVLRVLHMLTDNPSMADRMQSLTENLVELLREDDNDVVRMAIVVVGSFFLDNAIPISSPIALQLAEALLPLFDNEDSQVQLLSMFIFRALMSSFEKEGKELLKIQVRQSLLPFFFHCHDEKRSVAQASRTALLAVAKFLKWWDIAKLVNEEKLWKFGECLLAKDRSQAAEHLRHALPYLDSPQESLREAAVRFIGILGRHLRGQQEEFHVICKALEDTAEDVSSAVSNLALQSLYVLNAAERAPMSRAQRLHDLLRRIWKSRPRLCGHCWLSCWRSADS